MQRFKYLADLVKKSKEKKEEPSALPEDTQPVSEEVIPEPVEEEVSPPPKNKGNKMSKKEKRRLRELERQSSTSSAESADWCLVGDVDQE